MLGAKGIVEEYLAFITDYKKIMYRIAYGYLGEATKALDAVDEAVYLGYKNIKQLKEYKFLKTWLTRILINECYKILRKNKREIVREILPEELSFEDFDSLPLKAAVEKLPEDLRKIIVLRYFGDYTIAETSEILKIPEGTVSTRTRKALDLLRVEIVE